MTRWRLAAGRRMAAWQALLGRPDRALAILERLLRADPQAVAARTSRAHLLAQAGRWQESRDEYQACLARDPTHAATWFNLGFVNERLGASLPAAAAFEHATLLDPRLDLAWYGLGLALIRLGRFDEAAAALSRNVALQPMSPHGWYQLARVQFERREHVEAAWIIGHLRGFEPGVAAQLADETGLHA